MSKKKDNETKPPAAVPPPAPAEVARIENCPACGAVTTPINDFRTGSPTYGQVTPGAWRCATEGCPCKGGHFVTPGPSEAHTFEPSATAAEMCFHCGLDTGDPVHVAAPAAAETAPTASEQPTAPPAPPAPAAAPPPPPAEQPDDEDLDDEDEGHWLDLEELREIGAVLAESADGDHVDVVTRGGRRLRFPGDEQKAGQMTISELTGQAPETPSVETGTLRPRVLQDLEERDCIAARRVEDGKTIVVTKGGQKLTFPGDELRAGQLTDSELDGEARQAWPRAGDTGVSLLGKPIRR